MPGQQHTREKLRRFHKTEDHNGNIQYILYIKNSDKYLEPPGRAAERLERNEMASQGLRRSCQLSLSRVPLLKTDESEQLWAPR
jgi:hypothetical protein